MRLGNRATLAVASLLLALPVFAGCKKKGGGSGSAAAASAMGTLPKDATIVMGINMEKGHKAEFLKPLMDKVQGDLPPKAKEAQEKCGIDATKDLVKSITVAIKDPNDEDSAFAAVSMALGKDKANECAKKLGMEIEEKEKLVTYKDGDNSFTGHWANDNMLIVSGNDKATAETFKPVFAGEGIDKNEELSKLVKKTNTSAILWAAGSLPKQAQAMAQGATAFYAHLDGNTDVEIKAGILFDDEAKAKAAKTQADAGMQQAGMILGEAAKKIKIEQTGSEVVVSASFSKAEVDQLKQQLGGMMGGMMGGM